MTSCAHAATPCVDICDAGTYSAQVCAAQQPPATWGAWRPHRGPVCPWQQEGPPPRVVQPPIVKVVQPPPTIIRPPPMKKARAEEHPWSSKKARAEEFSKEEMEQWDSWAIEAERRSSKNAEQ